MTTFKWLNHKIGFFFCFYALLPAIAGVPDKASPFTAVKWEGDQPIVRFEGEWYQFHSMNGISVETIIEFCKETYERRWQKRFSEDLVEVLTAMGHTPDVEVDLVLSQNGERVLKKGNMTEDNRDLVRDFNNGEDNLDATERDQRAVAPVSAIPMSSQDRMALKMAEMIDIQWESDPPLDAANIKILVKKMELLSKEKLISAVILFSGPLTAEGEPINRHLIPIQTADGCMRIFLREHTICL